MPTTPAIIPAAPAPSGKNETPQLTQKQELQKVREILDILASDKAITDTEAETHERIKRVIDLGDSTEQAARKIEDTIYQGILTVIQLVESRKASVDNIDLFHAWRARLENRNQPLGIHDPIKLHDLFRSVRMEE